MMLSTLKTRIKRKKKPKMIVDILMKNDRLKNKSLTLVSKKYKQKQEGARV